MSLLNSLNNNSQYTTLTLLALTFKEDLASHRVSVANNRLAVVPVPAVELHTAAAQQ